MPAPRALAAVLLCTGLWHGVVAADTGLDHCLDLVNDRWVASDRTLVWSRAARVPWKLISSALGCDRSTAWRHWQSALTRIAGRLNAERHPPLSDLRVGPGSTRGRK